MELMKIESKAIGGSEIQTVNARDLHAFLEVGKVFAAWIHERIEQYGFVENTDFAVFSDSGNNPKGGRPAKEYAITIDMAKELAMVERNEKGKEARQYFIECEKRLKAVTPAAAFAIPQTYAEALQLAADQARQIEQQTILIEQQKPAVEFVGKYVDTTGTFGFRQVCKLLEANESEFRAFLFDKGIVYRLNGNLAPKAEHIQAGRFDVKTGVSDKNNHSFTQMRFTSKGVQWIAGMWIAERCSNLIAH
jgi:phage anti-repressor protein